MKLQTRPSLGFLCLVVLLTMLVAGCAPDASAQLISPQLGAQLYAQEADSELVVEPTPVPRLFADLSPEEVIAGLPDDFAALLAAADPSNGENLALLNGCVGCHSVDPAVQMTGPNWHDAADHAVNRMPGVGPANYLYTSIVNPGAYVVPSFPGGVMPATYADSIPAEDLADLVAYLLSLHQ